MGREGSGEWGVWTLVLEEEEDRKGERAGGRGVDVVGVIHVAGPAVECRSSLHAALALAVGNAMFCACASHPPARRRLLLLRRLLHAPLTLSTPHATARHGLGFMALAHADAALDMDQGGDQTQWMEVRMRLGGGGKQAEREERSVLGFVTGTKGAGPDSATTSGGLAGARAVGGVGETGLCLLGW